MSREEKIEEISLLIVVQLLEKIMSVLTDFAAKQQAHNDAVSNALDDIAKEIGTLNDNVVKLQAGPTTLTPEEQKALDAVEASGAAIEAKAKALDTLTPPVVPTAPA